MSGREKIEVTATILEVRDKSLKITDGTMKDFTDRETGEVTKRPVWFFLPKSQVEMEDGDMADIEEYIGKTVTLLMPSWLAETKGLV